MIFEYSKDQEGPGKVSVEFKEISILEGSGKGGDLEGGCSVGRVWRAAILVMVKYLVSYQNNALIPRVSGDGTKRDRRSNNAERYEIWDPKPMPDSKGS
jgi:hypothetical protein